MIEVDIDALAKPSITRLFCVKDPFSSQFIAR